MGLINPFKRDNLTVPNVVIPLADAPAHSPKLSEKGDNESNKSLDRAPSSENGASPKHSTTLTLEALRAEVEADIATATHDSSYDRMTSMPVREVVFTSN